MARPEFEVPEFVSESDSDQIQERMMGNLPADISDMEGDFPYDFTMPTAIEISQLVQFNLVRCLMVAFPEYSWGDWMDLHGAEAGVTRKEAVAATGTVSVAIYIRHDFGHVKSRRQKRPSHHAYRFCYSGSRPSYIMLSSP